MSTAIPSQPSRDILVSQLGPSIESHVAWFHHMQETQPVRYRPEYNMWEVFHYKDVQRVLLDYATFAIDKSLPESVPGSLTKSDPPRHRRLRGLVSQAFTPRRVEKLRPRLTQVVDELLAGALDKGKMDVVAELVYPLPVRALAEMLGLPREDQERFLQWSYQLLRQILGVKDFDNSELLHYFSELLDKRQRDPGDDLMSGLLAAEENGARLTREEIIPMCLELMTGGIVATVFMLGSALRRFCLHPEIYQALRADPSLIPGAIEETLRYDFSIINVWRTARHDTVLAGHEVKAGQYVVAWTAAANFDETYFPHSERFDIRRSPNPHLTFGYGIHICLGAPLARLGGRIALERIVKHFSDIRLDPESPVQFMDQMGASQNISSLGILFTKA